MSIRIPNSNQFSTGRPGTYFTPSDLTFLANGSDLPDTQTDTIKPDDKLVIYLYLRRNQFQDIHRATGYIKAGKIIDLPYEKQLEYVSTLTPKQLKSWYGASQKDLSSIKKYLAQFGVKTIDLDQEQRTAAIQLTYSQFRNAFLRGREDILLNASKTYPYYYNPSDISDSYLTASGPGSRRFASAIIGVEIPPINSTASRGTTQSTQAGEYYPTEIADFYNFPSAKETNSGKGVTVGIVGGDANRLELLNQGNAFDKYLKAQGINTKKLGRVDSPNNSDRFWGELVIDYSILRSIVPQANIKVSSNTNLYQKYAELVYDQDIDIISSSFSLNPGPGNNHLGKPLHELFLDSVLRGKSVVVAAGDHGTGNYSNWILPDGEPAAILTDGGDSAVLSVGGTAITNNGLRERDKTVDKVTGLDPNQMMWNTYDFQGPISKLDSGYKVYPTLQENFSVEDFIGGYLINNLFENSAGSSGVFDIDTMKMPAYQERNLEAKWQGTGRRYPDVSVLAGGNISNDVVSKYSILTIQNGEPVSVSASGTSAGAPLLAGLLARITSGLRKTFGKEARTGFINPYLYQQYNTKRGKKLFFDVPGGSSNASTYAVASSPSEWTGKYLGQYVVNQGESDEIRYLLPLNGTGVNGALDTNLSSTGKGFDAASGLGSINGEKLYEGLMQVWSTI